MSKNKQAAKRILALMLALVLAVGTLNGTAFAAMSWDGNGNAAGTQTGNEDEDSGGVSWEEMDPSEVEATLFGNGHAIGEGNEQPYADTDVVRALILMEDVPTTYAMSTIAMRDPLYTAYRETMPQGQAMTAARISREALDGKKMDVVWSFDIVTDAISVNVEYGKLSEIAKVQGVRRVLLEQRYEMLDESNNTISQQMTGVDGVRSSNTGLYGAGTSVAIIDTGLEVDHISFDPKAYEVALREDAEKAGKEYEEYLAGLNMITVDRIQDCLEKLHVSERNPDITAEDLYENVKVPFTFNYATGETDVSHVEDPDLTQGNEHGSHVAGIAAANRYVPASRIYDMNGDQKFDSKDAQKLMNMAILEEPVEIPIYTDLDGDGDVTAYDAYLLLLQAKEEDGEVYVPAATSVRVDGVAPEAQIVAMNVFSEDGGTYSSDYVAALEDAITLGCDVSNLSLGSPRPGFSVAHLEYDPDAEINEDGGVPLLDNWINEVFQKAVDQGMVMSISAGNSGNWADYDDAYQLLYADEGGIGNLGAPASYDGAFAVASVQNAGYYDTVRTVATGSTGRTVQLAPSEFGGNPKPWINMDPEGIGSEYEYVFLGNPTNLLNGQEQTDLTVYAGNKEDFSGLNCTGKIVVLARGNQVSFIDKHQNAEAAGALAVIVYNNEDGDINGTVAGDDTTPASTAKIPIVGITRDEAKQLFEAGTTGSITVTQRLTIREPSSQEPEMSSFSSWGTTTNLSIKPEITTPGGSILSVNGANGNETGYELMSGTSMSSPHNAGLSALAADYIHANDDKILKDARASTKDPGLTASALIQSLLMSTATPLVEHDGIEYSVRSQGAGLASIQNVVDAKAFLLVKGQAGGKVKAELGDRSGTKSGQPFSFTFTVNNLTNKALTYQLSDSILTTGTEVQDGFALATDEMVKLDATVSYAGASNGTVTVPANGSVEITASIAVSASAAEAMRNAGYTNGFYVEGYIYLTGTDVTHSIPLLGWYGDWYDPSMYDVGSLTDLYYGNSEKPSHINSVDKNVITYIPVGGSDNERLPYNGNVYNIDNTSFRDDEYLEERNSINNQDPKWILDAIFPTMVRSAKDFSIFVTGVKADGTADLDKVYYRDDLYTNFDRSLFASFYYTAAAQWYDSTLDYGLLFDWAGTDEKGNPLAEGESFMISFVAIPEYNAPEWEYDEDGNEINRPDLLNYINKKGTTLSWKFTVDNTAPSVVQKQADGKDDTFRLSSDNHLTFTVKDNRYVANVVVLDGSGSRVISYNFPNMTVAGSTYTADLDLSTYRQQFGDKVVIAVCDYAGNETYYAINLNGAGEPYGEFVGFQFDGFGGSSWVSFDSTVNRNETLLFTCSGTSFTAAEYVNGLVLAQTEDGRLYGIPYEDMLANSMNLEQSYICTLDNVYTDFAYNYADGRLYGMYSFSDNFGNQTYVDAIYLQETEALDDWGDPTILMPYEVEESVAQRQDAVGYTLSIDDAGNLYILALTEAEEEDENGDSPLGTTADLWKFAPDESGRYAGGTKVGSTDLTLDYLQSALWNHNDETLYWARFVPDGLTVIAELYTVNPETAECKRVGVLSDETAGIFAPLSEEAAGKNEHKNLPVIDRNTYATPILDTANVTLNIGMSSALNWHFDPWYATHKDVTFQSDDPEIAAVSEDGVVTGVSTGTTTITVYNTEKPELSDSCTVSVASISASVNGIISYRGGASQLYSFKIDDGVPSVTYGDYITAEGDFAGYGLDLASSTQKGNKIWASEWGNTGMVYGIDPITGKVTDMDEPIDGDMMFGLAYSEDIDLFTGIMNFMMYVDIPLPLTNEAKQGMLDSQVGETADFTWHKLDLSPWLNASQGNLITQEEGDIAKIVFCGITSMPGSIVESTSGAVFGGVYGSYYAADTTWVLLDNVGRLWYIDELYGVQKDEYGYGYDIPGGGQLMAMGDESDLIELDNGDGTYSLFVIRELVETPLYDMFLQGELSITYHFSDIYYAGKIGIPDEAASEDGPVKSSPMFFFSLYNYFDEAKFNDMYLYVQNREQVGVGSYNMPIYGPGSLYYLGNTGTDYIIATINQAEYLSGLEETLIPVTFKPGDKATELHLRDSAVYYEPNSGVILPGEEGLYDMLGWIIPESVQFLGWTDADGTLVEDLDSIELKPGLEFTATWEDKTPVVFKAGELPEGVELEDITLYYSGEQFQLPSADELESWYSFIWGLQNEYGLMLNGWTDKSGEKHELQSEVTLQPNMEFTASWKQLPKLTCKPGDEMKNDPDTYGLREDVVIYLTEDTFDLPDNSGLEWYDMPNKYVLYWTDADGNKVETTTEIQTPEKDVTYFYHVYERELSSNTGIESISYRYDYGSDPAVAVRDGVDDSKWTLTLPAGTEISTYRFTVTCTDSSAECSTWEDIERSEEDPLIYYITVHAENGETKVYTLTVVYTGA